MPVVIDHMGRIDASLGLEQKPFQDLLRLMDDKNVWVKVSGCDRATRQGPPYADAMPFARKLVAEFGDRCVWGTDWPHPNHQGPIPDDGGLVDLIADIAPTRSGAPGAAGRQSAALLRFAPAKSAQQGGNIMSGRLQDRIAIVTGAGSRRSRLGQWPRHRGALCRGRRQDFRRRPQSRRTAETVERVKAVGGEIVVHACDVTDSASVKAMVEACLERFGRIDILVNNVGGSAHGGPVEMSEEVWDAQVDFNLKSVFLTLKHVLPVMEKQKKGAIVNLASTSGIRFTGAFQVGYAATKAGVIQMSRVVAVQYAAKGIRMNTVIPGQLHTPMVEARLAKQRAGGDVEALLKQRLARIPIGFMGDGRDTANAALFLASDEARFVTGTEIVVDGGMSVRCD